MASALAIVSAFFYGVSIVLARVGLRNADSMSGAAISVCFSFLLSLIFLFYSLPLSHFAISGLFFFALAGISGPCVGRILLFVGIQRVGSSIASPLQSIKPLFSAVAAIIVLGEEMNTPLAIGTMIMVFGLAVISSEESGGQVEHQWSKKDLLFPIMAGAGYGISQVFRKMGLNVMAEPLFGVTVQNAAAVPFSLGLVFLRKTEKKILSVGKKPFAFFGLSGISAMIGQTSLFYALKAGNVVIVSPLSSITPLFVLLLGGLFLRSMERITWKILFGTVLIVAATVLITLLPR